MVMQKLEQAQDVGGKTLEVGDTVTTLAGDMTGRVCDICEDSKVLFVRVRPLHQSHGRGVWHAADQTLWLSASRRKKKPEAQTAGKG